ncbi:MAG: pentapeptide repeat-containing protein [Nitrososphaerota archaeon]|nr:pentapeptide repeat-containing protein [Nitrososphaerota archaeon]
MATFYKFLNENLQGSQGFVYDLPRWDQESKKWVPSSWVEEKNADATTLEACGAGLHLMKVPNPRYGRYVVGFVAEGDGLCGEDDEKARFRRVRLLRPLLKEEIFHEKADLHGADLQGAHLHGADLRRADLRRADLRRADLQGAHLHGADLRRAHLHGADLQGADLQGADLQGADLQGAHLHGADLRGAHGVKGNLSDELTEEACC